MSSAIPTTIKPKTAAELKADETEYAKLSSKYKDPLYKPWWISYFSKEQSKFFTHHESLPAFLGVQALSASIWMFCLYWLYRAYKEAKGDSRFLKYFLALASIPFVSLAASLFTRLREGRFMPHIPPEYPACLTPGEKLSPELQKAGVVAAIDGHCYTTQYQFLQESSNVVRVKSYNLMYALFSLVLLFFSFTSYSKFIKADNPFLRESLRVASLLSLTLFTAAVLGTYYWYSLFILKIYNNIIQMNVSTVLMHISYLLYLMVKNVL